MHFTERELADVDWTLRRGGAHLLDARQREIARAAGRVAAEQAVELGWADASEPATGADDAQVTRWFFDPSMRWIRLCGLPRALHVATGTAATWSLVHELFLRDGQTASLGRRCGSHGEHFAIPQRDLIAATGLPETTLRSRIAYLRGTALLSHYVPGRPNRSRRGGAYSIFGVDLATIRELFAYVGPRLPERFGGVVGLDLRKLPEGSDGLVVYGAGGHIVGLTWQELYMLQQRAPSPAEAPELAEVAGICQL